MIWEPYLGMFARLKKLESNALVPCHSNHTWLNHQACVEQLVIIDPSSLDDTL